MPNSLLIPWDREPGSSGGAWHTHSAQAELFPWNPETLPASQEGRRGACWVLQETQPHSQFNTFFWGFRCGNVTGADQGRKLFDLL